MYVYVFHNASARRFVHAAFLSCNLYGLQDGEYIWSSMYGFKDTGWWIRLLTLNHSRNDMYPIATYSFLLLNINLRLCAVWYNKMFNGFIYNGSLNCSPKNVTNLMNDFLKSQILNFCIKKIRIFFALGYTNFEISNYEAYPCM